MVSREVDEFLKKVLRGEHRGQLSDLLAGYELCAQAEGKSASTITIVEAAVRYLAEFLIECGLPTDLSEIRVQELRHFIVHLQQRQRFAHHPFTKPQAGRLSGHTVNGYLRALRAFWSWAGAEGLIEENPFTELRLPKTPKKVIPTFTEKQIGQLIAAIDTTSATGHRDYTIILTFLDTGVRCSELTNLKLEDVNLESRQVKVWGKGAKERIVPMGAKVQKALWKYLTLHRPEPAAPRYDHAFLTRSGWPLTKDRVEAIVERYGKKAAITGIRVSPHTFRHTFAIMFLRNGGDVFTLQRIMGHSTLDVLRIYLNMAQADINEAHRRYSPADNMDFKPTHRKRAVE